MNILHRLPFAPLLLLLLCVACRHDDAQDHDHDHATETPAPSDRIAVPPQVRQNLGIVFVPVERRRVAATLRLPGSFELLPAGRHEYRTPVAGRVELAVQPLQPVQPGDLLYRIDAPAWRQLQRELGDLIGERAVAQARLDSLQGLLAAHARHEERLHEAIAVAEVRLHELEALHGDVGGQAAELATVRLKLAELRADLAEIEEKDADLAADRAALETAQVTGRDRFGLALANAAALTGRKPDDLLAVDGAAPLWRSLAVLEVRAQTAGIADTFAIASGGWVEIGGLVLTSSDPSQLRFRARALQSDLGRLPIGAPARVLPPTGFADAVPLAGALAFGVHGDPEQRTLDAYVALPATLPSWARPGLAGFVAVESRSGGDAELAVPSACVLPDGLQRVLFRRDPQDPDRVIRMQADLGVDDGRWVEIRSGLADGDQVVAAGAYELMLASSGSAPKGGHFHADGTFHAEEHK